MISLDWQLSIFQRISKNIEKSLSIERAYWNFPFHMLQEDLSVNIFKDLIGNKSFQI